MKREVIMKRSRLIAVLLSWSLLAGFMGLIGCGGGNSADNAANFTGTWELATLEEAGVPMDPNDIKMLKDMGLTVEMVFAADGKFTLDIFGDVTEGTWKAKNASTCTVTIPQGSQDAKIVDGQLIFEDSGVKLFMKKK